MSRILGVKREVSINLTNMNKTGEKSRTLLLELVRRAREFAGVVVKGSCWPPSAGGGMRSRTWRLTSELLNYEIAHLA